NPYLYGHDPQVSSQAHDFTQTNVQSFRRTPGQPNRSVDSEANVVFDRSTGPRRGRAYMVYTDAPTTTSDDLDVFVRTSDNSGATWSAPVRVNDDQTAFSQFLPAIASDPVTGNVAVSW